MTEFFEDKRVLITGGASGLGKELAAHLLSLGALVWIVDSNHQAILQLQDEWDEHFRSLRARAQCLDITNFSAIQNFSAKLRLEFGGLDILINNAGIVQGGPFLDVPLESHLRTIDVNLKALIAVTHEFLPLLIENPNSRLIQIGSVTGLMGLAFGTTYSSSKWGVLGFSESLRQELRAQSMAQPHLCVVCPSYVSTGMFEGSLAPKFMPFLNPSRLALRILKASASKKNYVMEPFLVKTVPYLRALLPLKVQDWILDWLGVAQGMQLWRGHSKSASDVPSQTSTSLH